MLIDLPPNWNLAGRARGQFVTSFGQSTHNSWAPRPVLPRKLEFGDVIVV